MSERPFSLDFGVRHVPERKPRRVSIKVRSIKGLMGLAMSILGPWIANDAPAERFGHFGLRIGDRVYELHCDNDNQKDLLVYRLEGDQIWESDINEASLGYSDMTNEEIDAVIASIESNMRRRGPYHVFRNNCHMFIQDLWQQTCLLDHNSKLMSKQQQSEMCPDWFKPAPTHDQDDNSLKTLLRWTDLLGPFLSLLFTIFSPNNYPYVFYGILFRCAAIFAVFLGSSAITRISMLLSSICAAIVFARCTAIYARGQLVSLQNALKEAGRFTQTGFLRYPKLLQKRNIAIVKSSHQ